MLNFASNLAKHKSFYFCERGVKYKKIFLYFVRAKQKGVNTPLLAARRIHFNRRYQEVSWVMRNDKIRILIKENKKINVPETLGGLVLELQKKGFQIEKAQLSEDEPIQCDKCMKENCFEFHGEGWFIEGEFYCKKHKADALNVLKQIDEGTSRRKKEEEEIIKKRLEASGL